jgi:hypothetical protein
MEAARGAVAVETLLSKTEEVAEGIAATTEASGNE